MIYGKRTLVVTIWIFLATESKTFQQCLISSYKHILESGYASQIRHILYTISWIWASIPKITYPQLLVVLLLVHTTGTEFIYFILSCHWENITIHETVLKLNTHCVIKCLKLQSVIHNCLNSLRTELVINYLLMGARNLYIVNNKVTDANLFTVLSDVWNYKVSYIIIWTLYVLNWLWKHIMGAISLHMLHDNNKLTVNYSLCYQVYETRMPVMYIG